MRQIVLVATCVMFPLASLYAADEPAPVGFIAKLSGDPDTVLLCKGLSCDAHGAESLKPERDVGRILFENQTLKCTGNGMALVHTSGDAGGKDFCKTARNVWWPMPKSTERIATEQGFESALRGYGRRAGRDKGSDSPVYSPPDKGGVVAGDFIIRWRTRPPLNKIAVSMLDSRGKTIARLENVDGNSGLLDSAAFREALVAYRDSAEPSHETDLVVKTEDGTESSVKFSVLSRAEERDLGNRLKQVDPSHGLFQYVERVAIYESLKMYDKAAAEYDSALKEAPGSRDMMQAAYNAHARIGDLRRARELRDKLDEMETPGGKQ